MEQASTASERIARATYTVPEAAAILGLSDWLTYEMIKRKAIPSIRMGRRILIPRLAIARMLENPSADPRIAASDS